MVMAVLEDIFGSRVGVRILVEAGRKPYREFYLSEISKNLGIGIGRTKAILDGLAEKGVLSRSRNGNRLLFRLNANSPLAFEIIRFSHLDAFLGLPEKYRTSISNFAGRYREAIGDNLVSIVVFGSVAKGSAKEWSDIDVFIVVKVKPDKKATSRMLGVSSETSEVFSNVPEEHVYTAEEFGKNYAAGDDFLINVMRHGILIHDNGNFFAGFLLRGIPEITRKSIERRLSVAKEHLDSSLEMSRRGFGAESQLNAISINLSGAMLVLNHVIPESKHEIPKQLEDIGERKLAGIYKKAREWFDSPPLSPDKDEVWEILNFLREKYNECRRRLETWS